MARKRGSRADDSSAVRVLSVPHGAPVVVRFLGPVEGINLHWHSGRSVPCQGPSACPSAVHKARAFWRGYGPVQQWQEGFQRWVAAVLEVTEGLEEYLRGRTLRGEVWMLLRDGEGGKRAPVEGVYCSSALETEIPLPFDILPVLQRFFHCLNIELGAPNPLPSRTIIPAQEGAPPELPDELRPAPAEKVAPQRMKRFKEMIEERQRAQAQAEGPAGPSANGQH